MYLRALALLTVLLLISRANASIVIPKNLKSNDRQEVLRIIGFGTSSKLLTDPYPLGGYSGFEFGLEVESLPTDDLATLGDKLSQAQEDIAFPKLTLGKGLFENFDFFLQFTPYNRQDEISTYGGIVRWGFYQGSQFPVNSSILLHYNAGSFSNELTTQTYGADLVGGINVDNVALYAGLGIVQTTGTFLGGSSGVTDTGLLESEMVTGAHSLIGANVRYEKLFAALELDHYTVSVFSGKLGMRF